MPEVLVRTQITCPYCYSAVPTTVDISDGAQYHGAQYQQYYEDCEVCCAPMELQVHIDEQGEIEHLEVKRGNG